MDWTTPLISEEATSVKRELGEESVSTELEVKGHGKRPFRCFQITGSLKFSFKMESGHLGSRELDT